MSFSPRLKNEKYIKLFEFIDSSVYSFYSGHCMFLYEWLAFILMSENLSVFSEYIVPLDVGFALG